MTEDMKIKLRKTDRLYTKLMRIKYDFTCQRCGRVYDQYNTHSLLNLGVSHYYGRSAENTRFDDENVTLLCNLPCHHLWGGEEREEYKKYMVKRLGQEGFDLLTLRANTRCDRDDKAVGMVLKAELDVSG